MGDCNEWKSINTPDLIHNSKEAPDLPDLSRNDSIDDDRAADKYHREFNGSDSIQNVYLQTPGHKKGMKGD